MNASLGPDPWKAAPFYPTFAIPLVFPIPRIFGVTPLIVDELYPWDFLSLGHGQERIDLAIRLNLQGNWFASLRWQ
jgi:hypothetical protein